jgi:MoaA/NifB/PqqE/SkfB family radical SAM enzyme
MNPETLEKILTAVSARAKLRRVHLYRLGEPLLHPQLAELCEVASKFAKVCISTTGHFAKCDVEKATKHIDTWIVSTGGWSDDVYKMNHPNGNPATMKAFLWRLQKAKAKRVLISYHRYKYNVDKEEDSMRAFTKSLGFVFDPYLGVYSPKENWFRPNESLPKVAETMLVHPVRQLEIIKNDRIERCSIIDGNLAIGVTGDAGYCCQNTAPDNCGNVLIDDLDEIWKRKEAHPICVKCQETGTYRLQGGRDHAIHKEAGRLIGQRRKYFVERLKYNVWKAAERIYRIGDKKRLAIARLRAIVEKGKE